MSVEEKLFKALSSSANLTSLVGDRIHPFYLPQGVDELPSIVFERNGGEREYTLSGYVGLENPQMTVTVYAETVMEIAEVSTFVLSAIENTTAFSSVNLTNQEDEWDDELRQRARFIDFSIWNRE